MAYYADLNPAHLGREWQDANDPDAPKRAIANLRRLREGLVTATGAPPPRRLGNLVLGTWNIREFGAERYGPRLPESYAYIAEIVDRFDLVAIQEVRGNLGALEALERRLGGHWEHLVSDVTQGRPGNDERLAFLWDTRKVQFLGVAGELVLPPVKKGKETVPAAQVARTPLMAAFQVGWTKFVLSTVHIIYGVDDPESPERLEEIRQVAGFLRDRSDDPKEPFRDYVLVGDFNVYRQNDKTAEAIEAAGFEIPKEIKELSGSNLAQNKKYDQIAYRARPNRFEFDGRAGVFKYTDHVFRDDEADVYRKYLKDTWDYADWRTYQVSDHHPLWAEFDVDFSDEYLTEIGGATVPAAVEAPKRRPAVRKQEKVPVG